MYTLRRVYNSGTQFAFQMSQKKSSKLFFATWAMFISVSSLAMMIGISFLDQSSESFSLLSQLVMIFVLPGICALAILPGTTREWSNEKDRKLAILWKLNLISVFAQCLFFIRAKRTQARQS